MSPMPGRSTLITSAPNQARSCVQVGPDCTCVKSRMRTPSSALPSLPKGLDDGFGMPFEAFAFAAGFFDFSFTTFFEAALLLAFAFVAFFRVAIVVPLSLFLLQRALRIKIADAAALGAGRWIEHCVNERRLAG